MNSNLVKTKENKMRKKAGKTAFSILAAIVVVALVLSGLFTISNADSPNGLPAAKATSKVANITLIDSTTQQDWVTILSNNIKTANMQSQIIAKFLKDFY